MLPKHPMLRHRPTNTTSGKGTFSQTLGTGTTMFGIARVHRGETTLIMDKFEDVVVGDIFVIDSKQYRVAGDISTLGAPVKEFQLERVKKPIA